MIQPERDVQMVGLFVCLTKRSLKLRGRLPRVEELLQTESNCEKEAEDGDNNVGPAEELVLSSDPGGRRKHDLLCARERTDREDIVDLEGDGVTLLEVSVDNAVKLPEGWETRGSHPDDELLITHVRIPLVLWTTIEIAGGSGVSGVLALEVFVLVVWHSNARRRCAGRGAGTGRGQRRGGDELLIFV